MKKIMSYILTFFLIIVISVLSLSTIVRKTLLNKQFVIKSIEKNEYYEKTYNEIIEKIKDNTIQAGLDIEIIDEVLTKEKVKEDINLILNYMYDDNKNDEFEINVEPVIQNLNNKIETVIGENNKAIAEEEQESIKIYLDTIEKIYINEIEYSRKYIDIIRSFVITTKHIITDIQIVASFILLILYVGLILTSKSYLVKYLGISFIATGLLLVVPMVVENVTITLQNVLIVNKNFSQVFISIVDSIIFVTLFVGVISLIIGALFTLRYASTNKKRREEWYKRRIGI